MHKNHIRSAAALCLSALLVVGGTNFTALCVDAVQQSVTSEFTKDNFTYRINGSHVALTAYSGTSTSITVPASVVNGADTYTVTAIGSGAFSGSAITSISLPSTVVSIEEAAFANCGQLTSVDFSGAYVSIENRAFKQCTLLSNVYGTENICKLGVESFDATPWKNTVLRGSEVYIGHVLYAYSMGGDVNLGEMGYTFHSIAPNAFANNTGLTSVVIPDTITDIGDGAFAGCSSLGSLVFGTSPSLAHIGQAAFDGAGLGGTLTLPTTVGTIGSYAFRNCTALTGVVLSENATLNFLPTGLFSGCGELTTVTLPSTIKTIGNTCFNGCKKLSTVAASGVLTVGTDAFRGCSVLSDATAFSNVRSIDTGAFDGTALYTALAQNSDYVVIGKVLYRVNLGGDAMVLTVPNGVVSVTPRAAVTCPAVSTLYLPDELTSIHESEISLTSDAKIVSFTRNADVYETLLGSSFGDLYVPSGVLNAEKHSTVTYINGLTVSKMPNKTTYAPTETADFIGIELSLSLDDGEAEALSGVSYLPTYTYDWSVGNTVTVSYEGLTTTFNVTLLNGDEADSRLNVLGVQVRVPSSNSSPVTQGLRFVSTIDRALYDTLYKPTSASDTGVGFGSLVFPAKYLDSGVKLTKETTKTIDGKTYYPATVPAVILWCEPDTKVATYTVCLTGIPQTKSGFTVEYTVVPYATYTDANGKEVTVYGESYTASLFDIAKAAYETKKETTVVQEYLLNKILNVVDPVKYPADAWSGLVRP